MKEIFGRNQDHLRNKTMKKCRIYFSNKILSIIIYLFIFFSSSFTYSNKFSKQIFPPLLKRHNIPPTYCATLMNIPII